MHGFRPIAAVHGNRLRARLTIHDGTGGNLICFTTGRGSAYGCAPSPSLKLATNSALWQRQQEDMDINCSEIADGGVSVAEVARKYFE